MIGSFVGTTLSRFHPLSRDDLKKLILSKPIKASTDDLLPSSLLRAMLDVLMPDLEYLVNLSLISGSMDGLKDSVITPLFKKHGLDPEDLSSYRPINNILYLGKLIERAVLPQLNNHMSDNKLHINTQ